MKKASLTVLFSLSLLAGAAYAQTEQPGVTESTDPAKAADVEQKAQAIQQNPQQMPEESESMHKTHKTMHHNKMMHKHHMSKPKTENGEASSAAPASGASQ